MWAIVDYKINKAALKKLENYAEPILFNAENLVYSAIDGHPDLFIFQKNNEVILAPNIPRNYIKLFEKIGINFTFGLNSIGEKHPLTTWYNASFGGSTLICNPKLTDESILKKCANEKTISVHQSYSRCNVLIINDDFIINSDKGIAKKLNDSIYFNDDGIELVGVNHGFIGGCLGLNKNQLFVNGSSDIFNTSEAFQRKQNKYSIELIELHPDSLQDIGSIVFIDTADVQAK